jgi:hypothetical protein
VEEERGDKGGKVDNETVSVGERIKRERGK